MVYTLWHARVHGDTCTPGSWHCLEQSVREESYINDSDCQAGGYQRTWSSRDIWTWNSWWRGADRPEESIIDQKGSFSSKLAYINIYIYISTSDRINFNFKKLAKGLCFFLHQLIIRSLFAELTVSAIQLIFWPWDVSSWVCFSLGFKLGNF